MDGILVENPPAPDGRNDDDRHGLSLVTMIAFAFLTFNSAIAVYRSNGDAETIAFIGSSYLDLVLLFYGRKIQEGAGNGDPSNFCRRWAVKASVWTLTTLLSAMFSYKVAAVMPLPMAAVVCAMVVAGMLGVYYGFCAPPARARLAA